MDTWSQQFDAYPHWLVWTSLALTALAALWVIAKVMKWVFKLVLAVALVAVVGGVLVWALA